MQNVGINFSTTCYSLTLHQRAVYIGCLYHFELSLLLETRETIQIKIVIKSTYFSVLIIILLSRQAEAAECEKGWTPFNNELCLKSSSNLLPFDEAKDFCSSQGNGSVMVMIKDAEMQAFLETFTKESYDHFWLGSRYENETGLFTWNDGENLTYTNWLERHPGNTTATDSCIELRTGSETGSENAGKKWEDVRCQKRNGVICQYRLVWGLEDAIAEILKIRKELQTVKARVIPLGSIYIEYFNQPSPPSLWPDLIWEDITATYEGLFFRASGGGSAEWGATQDACAPRINRVQSKKSVKSLFGLSLDTYTNPIAIPSNGSSNYVELAKFKSSSLADGSKDSSKIGLKFQTESCEVRPKNQAVRIWKRMA